MKIFKFLLLVALFLQAASFTDVKSQTEKSNKTYVWSVKGLALREQPGISAKRIINIPYGKSVTIINTNEPPVPMSSKIEGYLSYKLEGKWIKVLYNGQEGYVFDGYLSTMPPYVIDIDTDEDYLKRLYGVAKVKIVEGKNGLETTTTNYKNGDVSISTVYDGCWDTELYLKNITYREAVLLMVAANSSDGNIPMEEIKIANANSLIKITYYFCD
jgi:hypothetical protein